MPIEIGQALVRLAAESDQLKGDLNNAKEQTKGWASNVGGVVKTALTGAVLGGATVAIGAVAGIGKAAFDMADDHKTAQANLRSQFGLTADEAKRVADLARESWGDNWGESIDDVAQAIGLVQQQLGVFGTLNDREMKKASEDAIALRDSYGIEVAESIDAASTLMDQFGLSGQEAMDFIAAGMQQGLNRTGDFLDTITEYSVQFNEGGAAADQFFGFLQSGLQGGMLGTDKAADAFKEFRVRIMDGSETTAQALEQLGFNAEEVTAKLASGETTVAGVWDDVTEALANTDDQAIQMQAGVGLIGTQFEDLGASAVLGLDLWGASMEDISGATDALGEKYTSFPALFEGAKRKILVQLAPISDSLLEVANYIMPLVIGGVEKLAEIAGPLFEAIGEVIGTFIGNLEEGMDPLTAFIEAIKGLAPPEVIEFLTNLKDEVIPQLMALFEEHIQPIIDMVAQFVSWKDILIILGGVIAATIIPIIVGLVTTIAPVIAIVAAVIGVVALLRNAWENDWGGIRTKLIEVWEGHVRPALEQLWEWLSVNVPAAIENLRRFWVEEAWPAIQNTIEVVWPIIKGIIETTINTISEIITAVVTAITDFWNAHGEEILATADRIWNAIKDVIDFVLETIRGIYDAFSLAFEGDWRGFGEKLREVWDDIWEKIKEIISTAGPAILEKIGEIITNVINAFQEVDWGEVGKAIINGIAKGISAGASKIIKAAKKAAQAALDAAKGFLGIGSPSKVFIEIGRQTMEGFALGLGDVKPVELAMASAAGAVTRAATDQSINYNFYLTANYRYQDEASLADDIRLLEMLRR